MNILRRKTTHTVSLVVRVAHRRGAECRTGLDEAKTDGWIVASMKDAWKTSSCRNRNE
ncbi:hypothetical protein LJR231_001975 [Phyllobacterium sp. LjRoot231]|uniref:hypothetical protein n=1 Tax=Phyllobacterium sp. LjRoot231 TaxID=3342289 RepID=UPI003ECD019A